MAELWAAQYGHLDKKQHMKEMLTLTTRMNALTRITLGNVNIAATTALQVNACFFLSFSSKLVFIGQGFQCLLWVLIFFLYNKNFGQSFFALLAYILPI